MLYFRHDLTPAELALSAGLSRPDAAALIGRSPHTFTRYCRTGTAPVECLRLLSVAAGWLPWPGWRGWWIGNDGRLYSPALEDGISPGEIEGLPWLHLLLARLQERQQAPAQYLLF